MLVITYDTLLKISGKLLELTLMSKNCNLSIYKNKKIYEKIQLVAIEIR